MRSMPARIVVPVEVDGKTEEWLVNFKNETHNHPTEIEPFGGAATCLGGAIRDPLSGRTYVYQAMRVTGAADPTVSGKRYHERQAAAEEDRDVPLHSGYSSYGNQIGLATGYVKEIYHPNYVAKRMEIGAVMGAAPRQRGTAFELPIRATSSSCSAVRPDVTVVVGQPVLPKHILQNPLIPAVPRYRKVMHRPSVNCRDCSAERK